MTMPVPDSTQRIVQSLARRTKAAELAAKRMVEGITEDADGASALPTRTNGEEHLVEPVTAFHKGVPHDVWGIPIPQAYQTLRDRLRTPVIGAYSSFDVPLGPVGEAHAHRRTSLMHTTAVRVFTTQTGPDGATPPVRAWESPLGGHQFDLEGGDAAGFAMAPAPTLCSDELAAEMADVYAMAVLRDTHFTDLDDDAAEGRGGATVGEVKAALKSLPWFDDAVPDADLQGGDAAQTHRPLFDHERARRAATPFVQDARHIFRGSTEGAKAGPYVSQFLLIGGPSRKNPDGTPADQGFTCGMVGYGRQRVDQRVLVHRPDLDHMTDWPLWLDVQNGANVKGQDYYIDTGGSAAKAADGAAMPPDDGRRFIGTPRDLATFVHFDELHQAYFNAALLLASHGVPYDIGLPSGPLHATRDSFATFGPGQLLSLLPEVANRGLKAVRRQKFQHHLRGRPEQLAAMIALAELAPRKGVLGTAAWCVEQLRDRLRDSGLLGWIAEINHAQNLQRAAKGIFPRTDFDACTEEGIHTFGADADAPAPSNYLLPMAFPEGSPMHAAYGAGHATVAGACVTVLKAFFEMSTAGFEKVEHLKSGGHKGIGRPLDPIKNGTVALDADWWEPARMDRLPDLAGQQAQRANHDRTALEDASEAMADLTIEGELDKLAANISIGRNMGGVHYYTDYYDSLRMGERVAVAIMHEQMLTYTDPVSMRFTSFDGDRVVIYGDGKEDAQVMVAKKGSATFHPYLKEWWTRHAGTEYPRPGAVDAAGELLARAAPDLAPA